MWFNKKTTKTRLFLKSVWTTHLKSTVHCDQHVYHFLTFFARSLQLTVIIFLTGLIPRLFPLKEPGDETCNSAFRKSWYYNVFIVLANCAHRASDKPLWNALNVRQPLSQYTAHQWVSRFSGLSLNLAAHQPGFLPMSCFIGTCSVRYTGSHVIMTN